MHVVSFGWPPSTFSLIPSSFSLTIHCKDVPVIGHGKTLPCTPKTMSTRRVGKNGSSFIRVDRQSTGLFTSLVSGVIIVNGLETP